MSRSDDLEPPLPPEVAEAEAGGEVARLYGDIRWALRSPNVNLVYRLLAHYPDYLAAAWSEIGPNQASRYLEQQAERLRALAALDVSPAGGRFRGELSALGLSGDELARIRGIIDLFNYANPKNLIVVAALRLVFDGRAIPGSDVAEGGQPLPSGPLPDVEVRLVDPGSAPPEARPVLAEILAAHPESGAMPSVYRALANSPSFLHASWGAVRPYVAGPEFAARVRRLIDEAERAALGLPHPVGLSRARTEQIVGRDGAAAVETILRRFGTAMIPAMTVEVHTLKALLDGPEAARSSPLAWRG
ncbi:MAG: halocarboxylic acid dehydrogenase DehI family protein [Chloroflexota bacterium]|nr:halocarboxylic acid dehydrogenase DehI family protein [Chloroflexota bacterium]